MSDIAIRVENLSKQYRIGGPQARYKTLRESLTEAATAPFHRLRSVLRGQSSVFSKETIWALKDVSFEVKRGEVVGIIGRNGAGKTTLLKVLSRITKPTEGYAEIHGRVGSLLEVGTGFHPELTGRENIYLNGAILGMKKTEIERKFDEIVEFAEIERFLDTPVKRYSSGMYVRLAFAVAAHLDPVILLVDEVLAVGDAGFQKKCLGRMSNVAKEGRTVLFVSHNMGAVKRLCSRGLYLANGSIEGQGEIGGVCNTYLRAMMASGALSDRGISIKSRLADGHGRELRQWKVHERLVLEIQVKSRQELRSPAVDVAFYRSDGTKVFAIQSDRVTRDLKGKVLKELFLRFAVQNIGIASSELYFDIGVRSRESLKYVALFEQVGTISVSPVGLPRYSRDDCAICLPATVDVVAG